MQNWGECQGEKISGGPRHTPNTLAVQAMGPHRSKVSSTTLDPIKWGPRLGSKYNSTWRAPALPRIGLRFEGADHLMTPVRGNSAGGVHQGPLTSEVNSRCMSDARGLSDASRTVASYALSYPYSLLPKAQHNHSRLRVTTLSWPKAKLSPFAQLPSHHQYLSIHSILDNCELQNPLVVSRQIFI